MLRDERRPSVMELESAVEAGLRSVFEGRL